MASKDEQPVEKATEKGKGKLKLVLIIVGAVILTAGATFGVVKYTGGSHPAEPTAKTEKLGNPVILPLDPFIVNIYDGQELRYLRLKVEMEVSGEEAKTELSARQPQIRDAILILLSTKTLLDLRDQQGKNQLRQEIFSAVGKVIPAGKILKVYFTDFVVQ